MSLDLLKEQVRKDLSRMRFIKTAMGACEVCDSSGEDGDLLEIILHDGSVRQYHKHCWEGYKKKIDEVMREYNIA